MLPSFTQCVQEKPQNGEPSAAVKKLLSEVSLEIERAKQQKNITKTVPSPEKAPETIIPPGICLRKEGFYELGHNFKRALKTELQDVMIKMWQELPDESPSDVDQHVIDKFRGKLGDEFANLLRLNVRKRILGLNNTLFVKVKFESFISAACLAGFLKQYNVQKAKKVDGQKYVFVAKMKDYDDFDALCNTKDLIYDQVKFSVEPCYKFMTCPEILTTDKITTETKEENKDELTTDKITTETKEEKKHELTTDKITTENKEYKKDELTTDRITTETKGEKKEDIHKSKTERTSFKESSRYDRMKDPRSERYRSTRDQELERSSRLNRYRIIGGVEGERRKDREAKSDGKTSSSANGDIKSKNLKTSAVVKSKTNENVGHNKVKAESSELKDSAVIKAFENNAINSEKKHENPKSENAKEASEGSKDPQIDEDLDFEDMAMLLADSIVLDECSGSEDEEKS